MPLQPCIIADCGEHKDGDSWGTAPNGGAGDAHPDFPEDADIDFKDVSARELFDLQGHGLTLADSIRRLREDQCDISGNVLFCYLMQIQARGQTEIFFSW